MTISDEATQQAIESIRTASSTLMKADDDVVRMFGVRVDAMTRALVDSVLVDLLDA